KSVAMANRSPQTVASTVGSPCLVQRTTIATNVSAPIAYRINPPRGEAITPERRTSENIASNTYWPVLPETARAPTNSVRTRHTRIAESPHSARASGCNRDRGRLIPGLRAAGYGALDHP